MVSVSGAFIAGKREVAFGALSTVSDSTDSEMMRQGQDRFHFFQGRSGRHLYASGSVESRVGSPQLLLVVKADVFLCMCMKIAQ